MLANAHRCSAAGQLMRAQPWRQREGRVRPTVIALANALREKAENKLVFAVGRHALDLYPPHFGFMVIETITWTASLVYAYRVGGAGEVGIISVALLLWPNTAIA